MVSPLVHKVLACGILNVVLAVSGDEREGDP